MGPTCSPRARGGWIELLPNLAGEFGCELLFLEAGAWLVGGVGVADQVVTLVFSPGPMALRVRLLLRSHGYYSSGG